MDIADAAATEEGQPSVFPVNVTPASGRRITVLYATSDGTAKAGNDFMALTRVLVFPPGTTDTTIAVATIDDENYEPEENFLLTLFSAPQDATLGDAEATGTIEDNDEAP